MGQNGFENRVYYQTWTSITKWYQVSRAPMGSNGYHIFALLFATALASRPGLPESFDSCCCSKHQMSSSCRSMRNLSWEILENPNPEWVDEIWWNDTFIICVLLGPFSFKEKTYYWFTMVYYHICRIFSGKHVGFLHIFFKKPFLEPGRPGWSASADSRPQTAASGLLQRAACCPLEVGWKWVTRELGWRYHAHIVHVCVWVCVCIHNLNPRGLQGIGQNGQNGVFEKVAVLKVYLERLHECWRYIPKMEWINCVVGIPETF